MSEFFVHYPQISYNITGTMPPKKKTVINIMERAKIKNIVHDDIVAYYPYSIPEGERPDNTAFKYYGDVKYTWLIFLINGMTEEKEKRMGIVLKKKDRRKKTEKHQEFRKEIQ